MTAIATEIPANTTARNPFKNLTPLQKRARAKYLTKVLANELTKLYSPLHKQYRNTYFCTDTIIKEAGAVTALFCKNRCCIVCARNRSAELIKKYNPILTSWERKHFLTLTIPNVPAIALQATLRNMKKEFSLAVRMINYRRKKQGMVLVKCLLKTECTYNPETDNFHPHFHVVTDTYETAQELYLEWIERFKEANPIAQDLKVCDDRAAIELFKYFTKIITKKDKERGVDVQALDIIFRASKGVHTFQTYGFKAPKLDDDFADVIENELSDSEREILNRADEVALYSWEQETGDWIERKTGEALSGHVTSRNLKELAVRIRNENLEQVGTEKREIYLTNDNIHPQQSPPNFLKKKPPCVDG